MIRKNAIMEGELSKLEAFKRQTGDESDRFHRQRASLDADIDKSRRKISDLESSNHDLKSKMLRAEERHAAQKSDFESSIRKLMAKLEAAEVKNSALAAQTDIFKAEIQKGGHTEEVKELLKGYEKKLKKYEAAANEHPTDPQKDAEILALKSENGSLKQKLQLSEMACRRLEDQLSQQEIVQEDLVKRVRSLLRNDSTSRAELESALKSKSGEVQRLETEISLLSANHNKTCDTYRSQLTGLARKLSASPPKMRMTPLAPPP
eukprot:TRINITY_DN37537_c0_g1_i1.p1 TRINITY_DN37537_c0_g1~~TRINITY_DN37537_c0_g1_i1.p1  ORF type:complete len:263 (+),score=55.52 TRINITY_DN37537_c0_g1_i1:391-1179(+)